MYSRDYKFGKCVQHKVEIGPSEVVVKGRYHAYFAELTKLMVEVETTGDIVVWIFCYVWFYVDENVLEESDYLP